MSKLKKDQCIVAGKVFKPEQKTSKNGKLYSTGSIGVSKKDMNDNWVNGFLRFTYFGSTVLHDKTDYTLKGKLQPSQFTKKDGTQVDTFELIAFELEGVEAYENTGNRSQEMNRTIQRPAPIEEDELPF